MSDFRNTLAKGALVKHVTTGAFARVYNQPRESSRNIAILFDGKKTAEYCDVMLLRFVVGQPNGPGFLVEDEPPIVGTPPTDKPPVAAKKAHPAISTDEDAISKLFDQKRRLLLEVLTLDEAILRLSIAAHQLERIPKI